MQIDILSLFPQSFSSVFETSIIKRAQDQKIVTLRFINIRDFGIGKHKKVDDRPYGGGAGMILRVDVLDKVLTYSKMEGTKNLRIVLLDPKGKQFTQQIAKRLSRFDRLIIICGHYEGVDERVKKFVDENISIGPYILTGGEIPAMVLVDSIVRLLPNVLKKIVATQEESFTRNSLEYPQYTRPNKYKKFYVPKILLSGNHEKIKRWREKNKIQLRISKSGKRVRLSQWNIRQSARRDSTY